MIIGVISDTHGLFDHSIVPVFEGVDAIIHAGDIGKLEVIDRLEEIAPVFAVEGNNDSFSRFPVERLEEMAGRRVVIRHIFGELHQLKQNDRKMVEEIQPDVVVFGHSHRPYQHVLNKTLLFNPGSAGPRRFELPVSVAELIVSGSEVSGRTIELVVQHGT